MSKNSTLIHTAKDVLFAPTHFFEREAKRIKEWKQPIKYFIFFTMFVTLFLTFRHLNGLGAFTAMLYQSMGMENPLPAFDLTLKNYVIMYVVTVLFLLFFTSLRYWITHWYVAIWNEHATFKETYKALTYSTTPGWLGMPFFVMSGSALYLARESSNPWMWFVAIASGICFLSLEIYSVYLRSYGLSKTQHISMLKSFLAIYILGFITYIFVVFVLEFILILFALFIMWYL